MKRAGRVERYLFRFFFARLGYAGFNSLQTGRCVARIRHTTSKPAQVYASVASFNSLQTGRCMQRKPWKTDTSINQFGSLFQFPSNGKVCCEGCSVLTRRLFLRKCFNSLQTGRCVARIRHCGSNSTQLTNSFSIPFKREGVLQAVYENLDAQVIY